MKIILCHANADFDSFGSAVGLSLIHRDASIVFASGVQPDVEGFLAVYRDEFRIIDLKAINLDEVSEVLVVDTSSSHQVGNFAEVCLRQGLKLHIVDHHTPGDLISRAHTVVWDKVGAAATLVVEMLIAELIAPSSAFATALALGIHADTGSCLFGSTTLRDLEALVWLYRHGAVPLLYSSFLDPHLTDPQRHLFDAAREAFQIRSIDGLMVGSAVVSVESSALGTGSVVAELHRITEVHLCLLLVNLPQGWVHVVARSSGSIPYLRKIPNVGDLLRQYGGGGHQGAGSARVRGQDAHVVLAQITATLEQERPWSYRAEEAMSFPLHFIDEGDSLQEAGRLCNQHRFKGLPVSGEEGRLVGIISLRDVEKALRHGLGHAPVKAYMSRKVIMVSPDQLLAEVQNLFAVHDIGRVPVIRDGQPVGLITRNDLLRFHKRALQESTSGREGLPSLGVLLTQAEAHILRICKESAQALSVDLYLVGGAVRDLYLRSSGEVQEFTDLDLVVKRRADTHISYIAGALASSVAQRSEGRIVQQAEQFGTATLELPATYNGLKVDIAESRREHYPYPAADPKVTPGSLQEDLFRRDFSVNAIAYCLVGAEADSIVDLYGGVDDLKDRVIRVLHPLSFTEDPTRIIRGVRLAARRGFHFHDETTALCKEYLYSVLPLTVANAKEAMPALERRLGVELQLLCESLTWFQSLMLLWDLRAFKLVHLSYKFEPAVRMVFKRAHRLLKFVHKGDFVCWSSILSLLTLLGVPDGEQERVASRLGFSARLLKLLRDIERRRDELSELPTTASQRIEVVRILRGFDELLIACYACTTPGRQGRILRRYLCEWRFVKSPLTGADLKKLGFRPGPLFSMIQDRLIEEVLKHGGLSYDEACLLVRENFNAELEAQTSTR
jgi:tRNA nucleotidyltransferase (CCA-adding enzyme)